MAIDQVSAASTNAAPIAPAVAAFNDSDGPSFSDVLDILNPLQHIPIINSLYQHLTGDTEGAVADVAGGTLWAGPIGLISSLVDLSMRADGGKSASDRLLSWLGLEGDESDTAVAQSGAQSDAPAEAANPAQPTSPAAQTVAPGVLAAMAAATPVAPPVRGKAKDAAEKDDDKNAPQQRGDYLVFGPAGSAQPLALSPTPAPVVAPSPATAQNQGGSVGRQGDYLVFGGDPAPAPAAVAVTATTLSPPASAPPPNALPAGLSPLPAHSFAAPARRSQTAPTALPPPTTGPAAIPGHGPSQAISLAGDSGWFTDAFNAGLNKYQAAQKLTAPDAALSGADNASLH